MSGFVLDTSVLSAFAPGRHGMSPAVEVWFRERRASLHMSAVTILQVVQGISKLRRAGSHARAVAFDAWLDETLAVFGERVIPLNADTARIAGRMSDVARANGTHPGLADVVIAATARIKAMTVLTRNVRHFAPLGIDVVDPFETRP